ncbi:MAG: 3-oxoacyl-[acyl-carrier-protein] reductase [bacterium]
MQDAFSLAGKVAMVTGAGRGIGKSIALKLAGAGADIAACDLKEEWLAETAAAVRAMGRRAECVEMNVASSESVAAGVEKAAGLFGRVDILVNNAGITKDNLLIRMTDEMWNDVLSVNLTGTFFVSRAVSKLMMKQRSGSIINIASVIGLIGNAGQCNYAASKGGVIALTKSIARELASRNVRANAVAPGFIQTKMTEELSEEVRSKVLEAIPLKRWGQPEDVANTVLFLACDASSYLTGQVLSVGGGMVM